MAPRIKRAASREMGHRCGDLFGGSRSELPDSSDISHFRRNQAVSGLVMFATLFGAVAFASLFDVFMIFHHSLPRRRDWCCY